jgi:hypothetical protein
LPCRRTARFTTSARRWAPLRFLPRERRRERGRSGGGPVRISSLVSRISSGRATRLCPTTSCPVMASAERGATNVRVAAALVAAPHCRSRERATCVSRRSHLGEVTAVETIASGGAGFGTWLVCVDITARLAGAAWRGCESPAAGSGGPRYIGPSPCQATCCILFAKSRPEVGAGSGRPSLL